MLTVGFGYSHVAQMEGRLPQLLTATAAMVLAGEFRSLAAKEVTEWQKSRRAIVAKNDRMGPHGDLKFEPDPRQPLSRYHHSAQ